jgi:hypothetical protein
MASWWRQVALELGITGSGSWPRRVAEALQATEGNGPWTKHIAEKGISTVPADGVIVTDGQAAPVRNADNSATLAPGAVKVSGDPGALDGVSIAANYAIIQDGIGNFDVLDFGAGLGSVAVIARIANNAGDVQLANAATKIAINGDPIQVTAGSKTVPATVGVSNGLWAPFVLSETDRAIVSNAEDYTVQTWNAAATVQGQVNVDANEVTHIAVGPSHALVTNNDAKQIPVTGTYTNTVAFTVADGVITGIVLS